jgi:hypothetical protein
MSASPLSGDVLGWERLALMWPGVPSRGAVIVVSCRPAWIGAETDFATDVMLANVRFGSKGEMLTASKCFPLSTQ